MSRMMPLGTRYNQSLPTNVARGRVNTRRYFATNSNATFTFSTTNEIRIDISGDKNTFLNCAQSYLDFSLGAVTRNINSLDGGAHSWIQEMRIQSQGADLEFISNYNLLHTILIQYTSNVSNLVETNAISGGYRTLNMTPKFTSGGSTLAGTIATLGSNIFTASTTATGQGALTLASSGGRGNFTPHDTEGIAAGTVKQFCIPLISGFMSNQTYVPIGYSTGFTIILRLTQDVNVGVWATDNTGTYTISNISFNVPVITIDDPEFQVNFNGMLQQQGGVSWAGQTYRNYVSTVSGTGGDAQVILNDRSKSLNAVLCCLRSNVVSVSAFDRFSLSCRTIVGVNTFQLRIGDNVYPNTAIVVKANAVATANPADGRADVVGRGLGAEQPSLNVSRAMCEVMKSFRSLHSTLSTGIISIDAYSSDEGLTAPNAVGLPSGTTTVLPNVLSHYGAGLLGVDLTTYSSDPESISGINTAENNLNVTLLFNMQSQAGASYEVQSFAVCDAVYTLNYRNGGYFESSY
jgi:hypothetical protein